MDLAAKILVQPPQGIPRDLVVGYLSRSRSSVSTLRAAVDRSDYDAVRVFGHRLKGTGGAYGMPRLTELGAAIERAGAGKKPEELEPLVFALDTYLGQLEVAAA